VGGFNAGEALAPGASPHGSFLASNPHAALGMPDPHAGMRRKGDPVPVVNLDFSGIKKAEGGLTVAEVFAQRKNWSEKKVSVRGKVTRFIPQVMGRNWVHVRDGTGAEGSNDLTISTDDKATVGDTVLVTGTVALGKEFGMGLSYDVMLENAKVTIEPK
jgi:hypothetical protein